MEEAKFINRTVSSNTIVGLIQDQIKPSLLFCQSYYSAAFAFRRVDRGFDMQLTVGVSKSSFDGGRSEKSQPKHHKCLCRLQRHHRPLVHDKTNTAPFSDDGKSFTENSEVLVSMSPAADFPTKNPSYKQHFVTALAKSCIVLLSEFMGERQCSCGLGASTGTAVRYSEILWSTERCLAQKVRGI